MKKIGLAFLAILFPHFAFAASCPIGMPIPIVAVKQKIPPSTTYSNVTTWPVSVPTYTTLAGQSLLYFDLYVTNPFPGVTYRFSIKKPAKHANNSSIDIYTGQFIYGPEKNYAGSDQLQMEVETTCTVNGVVADGYTNITITVGATPPPLPAETGGIASMGTSVGNVAGVGAIIIDNTTNPGTPGITANMQTTVGTGGNLNVANQFGTNGLQVLQRQPDNSLNDEIGVHNTASTSYGNYGTSNQNKYFVNNRPVIDFNRFRNASDWMRANITPTLTHPAGTYGTITWMEFIQNLAQGRQMWGIVRVKVPLTLKTNVNNHGQNVANTVEKNADFVTVPSNTIYAFCTNAQVAGGSAGCAGAPANGVEAEVGDVINGFPITASSHIKVNGLLMMDFVNGQADAVYPVAGTPITPTNLPWYPGDIFVETAVPFDVNPAEDANNDGIYDFIDAVDSVTNFISCTATPCTYQFSNPDISGKLLYANVPQSAKDRFQWQLGRALTSTEFDLQDTASKYHLMMGTGYEQGWTAAMNELGITGAQWKALGFGVGTDAAISINDVRSSAWEDIPNYISTGGLFSMRYHVNFSGLLYIPQAVEMMQSYFAHGRQYVMGGIIVRDGFYIEANNPGAAASRGVTLITSDPASYASIKVNPGSVISSTSFIKSTSSASGAANSAQIGNGTSTTPCVGCTGTAGTQGGSSTTVGGSRYVIVRPQQ